MQAALHWYAVCAVALFLKMFALSLYQGYHRISRRTFRNPEDAAFVSRTPAVEELPQVQRAARAWINDLENIPIFLALGVACVLLDAAPTAAPWLFVTFTAARYVHTLMYLFGLQPWRTIAYLVGIACLFGMSWAIVAAV